MIALASIPSLYGVAGSVEAGIIQDCISLALENANFAFRNYNAKVTNSPFKPTQSHV